MSLYEKQLRETETGVQNMLNAVCLYNDKMRIAFNCKEGSVAGFFAKTTETAADEIGLDFLLLKNENQSAFDVHKLDPAVGTSQTRQLGMTNPTMAAGRDCRKT